MKTQLAELTEKLKKQQARAAKHQRAAERTQIEIKEMKQQAEREGVVVAGIKWGGYLTPSDRCNEPAYHNEETGLWYFPQKSAILHAYEQNLRLPTAEEYQQLYDRTMHEWTEQNGINGMLFTDKESGNELFFPASGYRLYSYGAFVLVGSYGLYWSSSVSNATYGGYSLNFNSGYVNPQNNYYRSYGMPVRCVGSAQE